MNTQDFIDGNKLRDGTDVTGSKYETVVIDANVGTVPDETESAYFEEQALDPYEVNNAQ